MKNMILAAFALAMTTAAYAQMTPDTTVGAEKGARVRFIHAVPGGPGVNVAVRGNQLFQNVKAQEVTSFKPVGNVSDGELLISSADGTRVAATDVEFTDNEGDYTILVVPGKTLTGGKAEVEVKVLEGDRPAPAATGAQQAYVTLVNASTTVRAADLLIGEDKVHAGVNHGEKNGPDAVDPSKGQVTVTNAFGRQQIPLTGAQNINAGNSYTAVVFAEDKAVLVDDSKGSQGAGATSGFTGDGAAVTGVAVVGAVVPVTTGTANMGAANMNTTGTQAMDAATTAAR